jgi:hypothetical protein
VPAASAQVLLGVEPRAVLAAAGSSLPSALLEARKLADQLRYEEAVVEYQRYLTVPERPLKERASALVELGFIHLVLADQTNAEARALEAFELDPKVTLPSTAPAKQFDFVDAMRTIFLARPRLELVPRGDPDPPFLVRVKVVDPNHQVARVLLRHALTSTGPFYSTEMTCESTTNDSCSAAIPPPEGGTTFTAWYFVEGLSTRQLTLARVASPDSPLQLAVVDQRAWYSYPAVWGIAGAVLVGIATVVYFLAPQPPR